MHRGRGLWSSVFSVPRGWKAASVAKLSAINVNSVQLIQAATWMEHFGAERSQVLVFEFAEPSTALHHVSDCDHVRHCLARAPISSTESALPVLSAELMAFSHRAERLLLREKPFFADGMPSTLMMGFVLIDRVDRLGVGL
eukprot:2591828-Rhodomonas_salina.1